MKEKQAIIVIGPPGSGKGTQAELLSEKFGFYHLETSEIIDRNLAEAQGGDFVRVGNKKYFLSDEKRLRESGKLMSPPVISFWMKNKIKELTGRGKGIVTSGSPRTLYEGKDLIPVFKKFYGLKNIKAILIEVSEKESIWRNSHRKTCQLMRHPIVYTKETARLTKCPLDGSKFVLRKDDTPQTIKIRLKEYLERTYPLVKYFKQQGLSVKKINGEQTVEGVFKDVVFALK